MLNTMSFINPRRACAARVTAVCLCKFFQNSAFVTSPQSLVARLCCIVLSLSVAYALCFNVHYEL